MQINNDEWLFTKADIQIYDRRKVGVLWKYF